MDDCDDNQINSFDFDTNVKLHDAIPSFSVFEFEFHTPIYEQ